MLNSEQKLEIFVLSYHEIWWMTFENKTAPFLYCLKLFASFQTINELELELQFRKAQFG